MPATTASGSRPMAARYCHPRLMPASHRAPTGVKHQMFFDNRYLPCRCLARPACCELPIAVDPHPRWGRPFHGHLHRGNPCGPCLFGAFAPALFATAGRTPTCGKRIKVYRRRRRDIIRIDKKRHQRKSHVANPRVYRQPHSSCQCTPSWPSIRPSTPSTPSAFFTQSAISTSSRLSFGVSASCLHL